MWLLIFEIRNPEVSIKVRDLLRFHGRQLRAGVFEVWASDSAILRILETAVLWMDSSDTMKSYRVCSDCRQSSYMIGDVDIPRPDVALII